LPLDQLPTYHADGGKHADASVLDLSFLQPLDVIVIRETEGVEASVACRSFANKRIRNQFASVASKK
jgi:hypothetical protein